MTEPDPSPVFAVTLRPHRSLGLHGFRLVMTLVAGASLFASIPFVVLGFWPIAGFYGLDVLILYLALRTSFSRARATEEIVVGYLELWLRKVTHHGEASEWRMNPLWTRLHRETDEEFGVRRLTLVSRGEGIVVGGFLGPDERASLGDKLASALAEARRGPDRNG